jgi:hypothetical protein
MTLGISETLRRSSPDRFRKRELEFLTDFVKHRDEDQSIEGENQMSKKNNSTVFPGFAILGLAFLFLLSSLAKAELGGTVSSIDADQGKFALKKGELKQFSTFKMQELVSDKIKIRQFFSNNGTVFGVAWTGRVDTQLIPLLGTYAQDYQKAEIANPLKRKGRIPYRKVQGGSVTVETWDMLRRVQGKAYAPSLLPAHVTADKIK